jgi:hypothetical protein
MMTDIEIEVAYKLRRCQKSAKGLFGAEYDETVRPYIGLIEKTAQEDKLDVLPAAYKICEEPDVSGMFIMMVMAAACELIDGKSI